MADDLVLSGGGSTTVASVSVLELAERLRALSRQLDGWLQQLGWIVGASGDSSSRAAARCLETASSLAWELDAGIRTAAERYGSVEHELTERAERLGALGGLLLGAMAPVLAVLGLLMLPAFWSVASTLFVAAGGVAGMRHAFKSHVGVLSDPEFVSLVRLTVSSADNVMLGVAQVSPTLAWLSDDRQLGWFGLKGATFTTIAGLSALGVGLRETSVTVRRVSRSLATAPRSYGELAARIPGSTAGSPQVRIERYGRENWVAYVGGTIDTSFTATVEPFDDTSNLYGVAGLDAGSVRVAERALQEAGARPGDRLLAVGYSQGGIVATDLVRNGGYQPAGLVTFGSPTAGVALPPALDDVAVEHVEDLVPALGGMPRGREQGGLDRTLVRREVLDDLPPRPDESLPAHSLSRYQDTARELDACTDERVDSIKKTLAHVYRGEGQVTMWRGTRARR